MGYRTLEIYLIKFGEIYFKRLIEKKNCFSQNKEKLRTMFIRQHNRVRVYGEWARIFAYAKGMLDILPISMLDC